MNRPVTHSVLESQRYGVARHVEPPLGVVFYNQAAVLAPGANAASLLWTNAGAGVIGAY